MKKIVLGTSIVAKPFCWPYVITGPGSGGITQDDNGGDGGTAIITPIDTII